MSKTSKWIKNTAKKTSLITPLFLLKTDGTFYPLLVTLIICSQTRVSSINVHTYNPLRVPSGTVMNLFPRYGYLSLSMRVVPRNDSQMSWIFLEPVVPIFEPTTMDLTDRSYQNLLTTSYPIHNEFHIDLCSDISQLTEAYFRRFRIEGLEKPWLAFAGGWRTPSLSRYFGMDPIFVVGDYRYILVRVMLAKESGVARPLSNISVLPQFQNAMEKLRPWDEQLSQALFTEIGTHYVSSYLTGNSIYQVLVYDPSGFDAVKQRLAQAGWFDNSRASIMGQLPYLLPMWAKYFGDIFVLNGSPEVVQIVRDKLNMPFVHGTNIPNIFKMYNNLDLVKDIEMTLKDEHGALLGLELKIIDFIFGTQNGVKREWFKQSLNHLMELWETNFN